MFPAVLNNTTAVQHGIMQQAFPARWYQQPNNKTFFPKRQKYINAKGYKADTLMGKEVSDRRQGPAMSPLSELGNAVQGVLVEEAC